MSDSVYPFPHNDDRAVLHAPGECDRCDDRPDLQRLRRAWLAPYTASETDQPVNFVTPTPADHAEDQRSPRDAGDQPPPKPADGPAITNLVLADLLARAELGRRRYGVYLQADNGRDALLDAYQEALDLVVYLRQAIEERVRM